MTSGRVLRMNSLDWKGRKNIPETKKQQVKNTLKKEGICKGPNVISRGQRPGKNETVNGTMETDRAQKT